MQRSSYTTIRIASQFVYVRGHRPAKSGGLLFRSDMKSIEIDADDRCLYGGFKTYKTVGDEEGRTKKKKKES